MAVHVSHSFFIFFCVGPLRVRTLKILIHSSRYISASNFSTDVHMFSRVDFDMMFYTDEVIGEKFCESLHS